MAARSTGSTRRRGTRVVWAAALGALLFAPGVRGQVGPSGEPAPTPEQKGAAYGRTDGRLAGLDEGSGLGRSQALLDAWLRGFRRGLSTPSSWRRDASADVGHAEGERPGRAAGLEEGRADGQEACAAAFAQLRGRPAYRTQAPPPAPVPPPPPRFAACDEAPAHRLDLPMGRVVSMELRHCDRQESPLGWRVPDPDYPDGSRLRQRAREDGMDDDNLTSWIRGYKQAFQDEFTKAFRSQREMTPGHQIAAWELDGQASGRREGERRRSCEEYVAGYEQGFRAGFDEGYARGWGEGWAESDQVHVENAVVRIPDALLEDASGDGVVEPGEGVSARLQLVNAGLRDALADVLRYSGVVSVAASGVVMVPLPAQSRRDERLDLGRADIGAPLGASLEVRLAGLNGDERVLSSSIDRPVVLADVSAVLDVVDARLVARVRPFVRSLASRDADRDLRVVAGEASLALGVVRAGETREPEILVPVPPSALAAASGGDVDLRSGEQRWMSRSWRIDPDFRGAVHVASRLPATSPELDAGLTALSRRLQDELTRSLDDPKLYRRLEEGSDLAALGAALPGLAPPARQLFEQRLAEPLLARVEAKGTPRKVRRAVREALGRD